MTCTPGTVQRTIVKCNFLKVQIIRKSKIKIKILFFNIIPLVIFLYLAYFLL